MKPGKVYLVGAGPGDPELITLKAVRALGEADVVLVDALVNRDILVHAREARIVDVGKRGRCSSTYRSTPQRFIEKLMVRLARAGNVVVRLKGGDPFVFGRGGEEMLALREAGISCEVVSGITAGIGAPASIGIPVTHRGLSRGVTFVAAHGGPPLEWAALAASRTTLVFYMGLARLDEIAAQLMAAGLGASTPAAVIEQGTLAAGREIVTSLERIAQEVAAARIAAPALIVVGEVVSLADAAKPVARRELAHAA
jgi:uroporphyrin-III C-methyltransferase